MSDALLDVGVIALAHAPPETLGHETALDHVRRGIRGERETVVPYPAILGAHHVLREVYRMPRAEATYRLSGLVGARGLRWYGSLGEADTRAALKLSGEHNIDAWDGYYAQAARRTDATTVLTLDDDFDRVDGVDASVILSRGQFEALSGHSGAYASVVMAMSGS